MSVKAYNPYIAGRVRASRNSVSPLNIYAISRYKDRKDSVKSKTGDSSSLVFLLGVHEGNLNCIKLNDLNPKTFFNWTKKFQKNGKIKMQNIEQFKDVFKNFSSNGKALFEGYVKRDKRIYTPKTYRMYRVNGIQNIQEVMITPTALQQFYNVTID